MTPHTLAAAISNGRLLDPDVPVPLDYDMPPLDLPPLRTHRRFMERHRFEEWLRLIGRTISDDDLRRFRRRERDRARRARA